MHTQLQFTCVQWVDAYTLLSSNQFGELLSWNLKSHHPNDKYVKHLRQALS